MAAIIKRKQITSNELSSKTKKLSRIVSEESLGVRELIKENSKVPYNLKVTATPNNKKQSPTRFTKTAFIAALFASMRVYQKFISK
jgi:hypothetical protein